MDLIFGCGAVKMCWRSRDIMVDCVVDVVRRSMTHVNSTIDENYDVSGSLRYCG
jgi:hypothetical protein